MWQQNPPVIIPSNPDWFKGVLTLGIQIPPQRVLLHHAFGVQIPFQEVFGCLGFHKKKLMKYVQESPSNNLRCADRNLKKSLQIAPAPNSSSVHRSLPFALASSQYELPDAQCMAYLPTFMVNVGNKKPYIEHLGLFFLCGGPQFRSMLPFDRPQRHRYISFLKKNQRAKKKRQIP